MDASTANGLGLRKQAAISASSVCFAGALRRDSLPRTRARSALLLRLLLLFRLKVLLYLLLLLSRFLLPVCHKLLQLPLVGLKLRQQLRLLLLLLCYYKLLACARQLCVLQLHLMQQLLQGCNSRLAALLGIRQLRQT